MIYGKDTDANQFMLELSERIVRNIRNHIEDNRNIPKDYRWKYCWYAHYYGYDFEGEPPEWIVERVASMIKEKVPELTDARVLSLKEHYFRFTWD